MSDLCANRDGQDGLKLAGRRTQPGIFFGTKESVHQSVNIFVHIPLTEVAQSQFICQTFHIPITTNMEYMG